MAGLLAGVNIGCDELEDELLTVPERDEIPVEFDFDPRDSVFDRLEEHELREHFRTGAPGEPFEHEGRPPSRY